MRTIALAFLLGLAPAFADSEVTVPLGQKAAVPAIGLEITFTDVVADSRCPEGARCPWAGNANITLSLAKATEKPVTVALNTGVPPRETTYAGHVIRLKTLNPRPQLKTKIVRRDYIATFVITQAPAPATPAPPVRVPPKAARTVEQYYAGENAEHWVGLVVDRGAQIKLEDGSLWEINGPDRVQTMTWLVAQKISVSRNPNSRYPFKLTNTTKNAVVEARLLALR